MNAAVDEDRKLDEAAAQIRAAHERATTLWKSTKDESHPRNLAGLALVLLHERDTTETWKQMDISRTMGDQELLPGAPSDKEVLRRDWSDPAHCDQVIAEKKTRLKRIRDNHGEALKERREGVARLAIGKVTGEPVPHAVIARKTGLSLQQIAADLKASRQGIPDLADMLDVPEARVRATLDRAREAGIDLPPHDTEPLLFDPVAFRAWWDERRFGWQTADQHAEDMGADREGVAELLEVAEEIGDLPEHDDEDGERQFEPEAFRTWWAGRVRDMEQIAEGWAGATALAYKVRMPVAILLTRLSEAKKARRLPEHRRAPRGRRYNVEAALEFLAQRAQPEDPRVSPVSELAALVDESDHVVSAWLREAEQRGIPLPDYTEGTRWRRYDREQFPTWWAETRERTWDGALATLPELARLLDVPEEEMQHGLKTAERLKVVMPPGETTRKHGHQFAVDKFRIWWPAWQAAMSAGEMRFAALSGLADTIGLDREKAKRQVKAALERGRVLPPHQVDARGHRQFEVSAYQAWRRIVES
ncbi:hypothetical protein [Nonomuraea sp. NPDC005650]|uniref:hypothetical protein n=1 Tax=Nonomuraea sp. NPDC005650 TaxID=3157045 RepID=UPI0033BDEFF8